MVTFTFLGILLLHTATAAPALTGPQQLALQDDVNVLVYGVIQFSTALNELYNSTAQKLDRIRHRTDIYEHSLRTLHGQAQSAQQKQQEIRRLLEGLQAQDMMMWKEAQGNKEVLEGVTVGHQNLAQRLRTLEEMLSRMEEREFQDQEQEVAALKARLRQRNLFIYYLLGATQKQQKQMAQQTEKVRWIQEQMKSYTGGKLNIGKLEKATV